MSYTRLTETERWHIQAYHNSGNSIGWIARELQRSHATISRELRRNRTVHGYHAAQAQRMAQNRAVYRNQQRRKIKEQLQDTVIGKLRERWSPEQISGWLRRQGVRLSHETIYRFVWRDKRQGRLGLANCLRHGGRKYQKRGQRTYAGRGYIPGRIDIDQRPAIVAEKSRIGDWELDTIVGAGQQGFLVSLVERMSKYTKLVLVPDRTAETVKAAILQALGPLRHKVLTLTADNGKEFASHQAIAAALEARFFFAKPYHSWERGLNEHTNGLVRQFLPKKTNFRTITPEQVQRIENLLNTRPRKILGFLTPHEIFSR
jgi:IS30 family transposase